MKNINSKFKIFKSVILLVIILASGLYIFNSTNVVGAADDNSSYKLLAPLLDKTEFPTNNILGEYVPFAFKLAIGVSVVFALLMIVIGGFQYMSTDALQKKEDGKKRVENAIKGLLLVIAAWLILNTVNPNLLTFNLSISPAKVEGPAAATRVPSASVTEVVADTCPNCNPARDDLTYNLSSAYLNTLNCPTCVPLGSNIGTNGNTNTNVLPDTGDRLILLDGALPNDISWRISEAWPPIVEHANPCHVYGSCVDVSLGTSGRPATSDDIETFIDSAYHSGLVAVYEVKTAEEQQNLIASGVPANFIQLVPTINNNHFSVYNCIGASYGCSNLPTEEDPFPDN